MKTKQLLKYAIVFLLGSMVTGLTYHIRFNNDLLRRELLLIMENGNPGYFLAFVGMDFLLIMGLTIWLLLIKNKHTKLPKNE